MTKGEKLKLLRSKTEYTLDEVGVAIGVSKQTLFKYENDVITNIPSDKIENLAKFYSVSPAYLMGWEEKDEPVVEIETIAAHALRDLTDEEQEKILEYAKFIKAQRVNKSEKK